MPREYWSRRILRIRVLVTGVTGVLRDVIEATLATQRDIEVVRAHPEPPAQIDVVVIGLQNSETPRAVEALFERYPHARVLGIAGDGRRAYMHELRPHRLALGQLSPEQLIEVVRRAGWGSAARANGHRSSWAWSSE